jgi:hypothetical protein
VISSIIQCAKVMVAFGFNLRAIVDKAAAFDDLVLTGSVIVEAVRLIGRVLKDDGLLFKATREV